MVDEKDDIVKTVDNQQDFYKPDQIKEAGPGEKETSQHHPPTSPHNRPPPLVDTQTTKQHQQQQHQQQHHIAFRAKRKFPPDTRLNQLLVYADSTIMEARPKMAAASPPDLPLNEWLAINTFLYFNKANEYYGYLSESCKCQNMTIGPKYEYLWADGKTIKKPISIPANDYIDYLMTWIEANLEDTKIFPDYDGAKHCRGFTEIVRTIFKRLLRVFGHMEVHHKNDFETNGVGAEYDLTFQCLVQFIKTHKLVDKKLLAPIKNTIERWKAEDNAKGKK